MKMIELFAGISGFGLAAEWMGWEVVAQVEIDAFCNLILNKNTPNAKKYGDIKTLDLSAYRGTVDIIVGGFPCQPFSVAGKRKGTEDDRFLWAHFDRIVGEVAPMVVVAENVGGLLTIQNGMVFGRVITDLESRGYQVQSFVIPACATNAPHRRDRVWIIATNTRYGREGFAQGGFNSQFKDSTTPKFKTTEGDRLTNSNTNATDTCKIGCNNGCHNGQKRHISGNERTAPQNQSKRNGWECGAGPTCENATNSKIEGLQRLNQKTHQRGESTESIGLRNRNDQQWDTGWFEIATRLCRVDDGLPEWMDVTRLQTDIRARIGTAATEAQIDRAIRITANKIREHRLMALGNAIVPQVAFEIFKSIHQTLNTDGGKP